MRVVDYVLPPRSAYLHIPFCQRRCFYCDFPVVPLGDRASGIKGTGSSSIKAYLELLHKEIAISPQGPPLATVYIGGGTPSLLSPLQISSLLKHLQQRFGLQDGAEITLEMDPATFQEQDLYKFLDIGINRISLGGQSFDDKQLENIGRKHRRIDLLEACSWLSSALENGKLKSWSLDLIQNLPGHNLLDWESQLFEAISTNAPHISVYDLSIEDGTVFSWLKSKNELLLPGEEIAAEIMNSTSLVLSNAGLSRYEISNFAFPGHASRHNRVYWRGSGWWAFGLGSTSSPWGQRLTRPRTRESYSDWIETQEKDGPDESLLASKAMPMPLDEKVLVGLRCREGVDLNALACEWGWNKSESKTYIKMLESRWQKAIELGWLKKTSNRYSLTDPFGMTVSNQVLVEMMLWWESLPLDAVEEPILQVHPRFVFGHLSKQD